MQTKMRIIILIQGSYFDVQFSENTYGAAVSVESLHHLTKDEKMPSYHKLYKTLKTNGYFTRADYFALSGEKEIFYRNELNRLKTEQWIEDNEFFSYDTSLTVKYEIKTLKEAGFSSVETLVNRGTTYTPRASK